MSSPAPSQDLMKSFNDQFTANENEVKTLNERVLFLEGDLEQSQAELEGTRQKSKEKEEELRKEVLEISKRKEEAEQRLDSVQMVVQRSKEREEELEKEQSE